MREKYSPDREMHKRSSQTVKKKCKRRRSPESLEIKSHKSDECKPPSGARNDDVVYKKKCSKRRERLRSLEKEPDRRQRSQSLECSSRTTHRIKDESHSDAEDHRRRNRSRSPLSLPSRPKETRKENKLNRLNEIKKEEKFEWGKKEEQGKKKMTENNAKPDFSLSGKLAEEANIFNGVVIKYSEPEEARKPKVRWRLYPFKGETSLAVLHLHRQSAYLIGRDRKIADLPVDHPSCSKQHAVLQYRLVEYRRPDGSTGKRIRPYIIDLESANGTYVNNKKIEARKYVELLEKDVLKFAFSSREYVLLHEHSKDANLDDDAE